MSKFFAALLIMLEYSM